MVYLHISAYKNIIADLKDEISQLKSKIKSGSGAPATIEQISELENEDQIEESKYEHEINIEPKHNNLVDDEGSYENSFECQCRQRQKDEKEKEIIKNEISIVSEDILQLEQALIELDEQNTMNAIEISKRDAKVLLLK